MKTLIPLAALVAILALALANPAAAADATDDGPTHLSPLQIGQIFCLARAGNDMAPVEAIITAGLKKAIAKANALDAAYEKRNPGEKPPLGDGLPWQSSPDYTPSCTAEQPAIAGKAARVSVTYAFDGAPSVTDVLLLKPVPDAVTGGDVWRIDDVSFADKSGMRQEMLAAFTP